MPTFNAIRFRKVAHSYFTKPRDLQRAVLENLVAREHLANLKEFAQCFIDAGFGWGGNYSRKDGMHFTIAGFDMPRT